MPDFKDIDIRRCKFIKWLLFLLCRFPTFTSEFIREHIDKPNTEPAELADYKSNCATAARFKSILLVSTYIGWTIKNVYIVSVWLTTLDYDNYAENVREAPFNQQQLEQLNYSGQGATLRQVSCLLTNCTRLGPLDFDYSNPYREDSVERLVEDVTRLPLVLLCDRFLGNALYRPVMTLDSVGIFSYAITMYAHLLLGAWTTIQQMLTPASSDTILFVTSPKVTADIQRLRVRELLDDVAQSYQNTQPLTRVSTLYQRPIPRSRLYGAGSIGDQAVSNSIPSTRTEWWRERLSHLFFVSLLGVVGAFGLIALTASVFITIRLKQRSELYDLFGEEMSRMQCHIWPDNVTTLDQSSAFQPWDLDLDWTALSLPEATALTILSAFTVALLMSYYWCIVQDLSVWLAEVRMFMIATLVATRFQYERERHQLELELKIHDIHLRSAGNFHECENMGAFNKKEKHPSADIGLDHFVDMRHFYKIPILRRQFQESIMLKAAWVFERVERIDYWQNAESNDRARPAMVNRVQEKQSFRWYRINSKDKDRHYVERFHVQALFPLSEEQRKSGRPAEHFDQTDFDFDTMEQIYVNFRVLCENVSEQPMKLTISITYLLNYGLVLICVIIRRQFPILEFETIFIIVFASTIANYLIILAADFHAQGKKLQPLFWSLIAQLTLSKSPRAQHMRSLWLKLARHLDEEGGLAMKAFGMRVSYIFVIQLLIWTTTILSLALKPRSIEL